LPLELCSTSQARRLRSRCRSLPIGTRPSIKARRLASRALAIRALCLLLYSPRRSRSCLVGETCLASRSFRLRSCSRLSFSSPRTALARRRRSPSRTTPTFSARATHGGSWPSIA
jgi:hypothetical protein